jgi:hypothetical protein
MKIDGDALPQRKGESTKDSPASLYMPSRIMPQGTSVHICLNSVDPRHYEGWDGQLTACEADVKDTPRRHRVEDAVGSDA